MTIDAIIAGLRSGTVPALAVLHGDESWFIDEAVRLAREKFLGGSAEGYVPCDAPRRSGDPEGVPLSAALEDARTLPMFVPRKLLHFRASSLSEEDVAALLRYAKAPPSFARVVVQLAELGRAAAEKLSAAGASVAECRRLFDTPWPGRPEWDTPLDKWTAARAKDRGLALDLATAHLLTSTVGNDLGLIDSALSVLSTSGRPAEEEAVRDLFGGTRDHSIFSFGDAVYDRNAAQAHRIARNLFLEGVEDERGRLQRQAGHVANRLVWAAWFRLSQVYAAARLLADGMPEGEAVNSLGGKPPARRAVGQAKSFGVEVLRRHFGLIVSAWAELRSSGDERATVDALVARLIETEERGAAWRAAR